MNRARDRVRELRDICEIWKGSGEEKARLKWVDGLELMVEDDIRRKEEGGKGGRGSQEVRRETSAVRGQSDVGESGPGFLRRLREEIYME